MKFERTARPPHLEKKKQWPRALLEAAVVAGTGAFFSSDAAVTKIRDEQAVTQSHEDSVRRQPAERADEQEDTKTDDVIFWRSEQQNRHGTVLRIVIAGDRQKYEADGIPKDVAAEVITFLLKASEQMQADPEAPAPLRTAPVLEATARFHKKTIVTREAGAKIDREKIVAEVTRALNDFNAFLKPSKLPEIAVAPQFAATGEQLEKLYDVAAAGRAKELPVYIVDDAYSTHEISARFHAGNFTMEKSNFTVERRDLDATGLAATVSSYVFNDQKVLERISFKQKPLLINLRTFADRYSVPLELAAQAIVPAEVLHARLQQAAEKQANEAVAPLRLKNDRGFSENLAPVQERLIARQEAAVHAVTEMWLANYFRRQGEEQTTRQLATGYAGKRALMNKFPNDSAGAAKIIELYRDHPAEIDVIIEKAREKEAK